MKKIFYIIQSVLMLLLCFNYSCKRYSDCSKYEITTQEAAFLFESNKGDNIIFRNDITSENDTLNVTDKEFSRSNHDEPCNKLVNDGIYIYFNSSYFNSGNLGMHHGEKLNIAFYTNNAVKEHGYIFVLEGALQSITINSTTYNDVYIPTIDSLEIVQGDNVPWKIVYSKSKGFIRFYMKNAQTWSKL